MKQGKSNLGLIAFVAFAVFAVLWVVQGHNPLTQAAAGTAGGQVIQVTSTKNTATDTTVTVGPQYDELNPSTAATSVQHYVVVNGNVGARKNVTDSGTFSAAPGDKVQAYYGFESATYYAKKGNEFVIPDTGALNTVDKDGNHGLYNQVDASEMTVTVWNDLDEKMGASSYAASGNYPNNVSMSAGATRQGKFRITTGGSKEAYSPYQSAVAVCNYNGTAIKDFKLLDANGVELPKFVGDIQFITTNFSAQKTVKYEVGSFINTDEKNYKYFVEADATNGGGNNYVWCSFADAEYYQDTTTGQFVLGYADSSNADIGHTDGDFNMVVHLI